MLLADLDERCTFFLKLDNCHLLQQQAAAIGMQPHHARQIGMGIQRAAAGFVCSSHDYKIMPAHKLNLVLVPVVTGVSWLCLRNIHSLKCTAKPFVHMHAAYDTSANCLSRPLASC